MTIEEFNGVLTEIMTNISDVGIVSTLLEKIREAFANNFKHLEEEQTNVINLKEEIDSLRESNMNLFLKLGNEVTGNNTNPDPDPDPDPEPPSFDDLFNEKGELK